MRFEPVVPGAIANPVQALNFLNELSQLTQANLSVKAPPVVAATASVTAAATASAAPSASQQSQPVARDFGRYGSNNREYQPALSNADVVKALLDLHQNHSNTSNDTRPLSSKSVPGTEPAQQKYSFKKSWGASQPILSPRRTLGK